MTSPERTAVKLTPEVIRDQSAFLREALPKRFHYFFDCLCLTALASLSERQEDQIGHSASPAGQADRSDMPEEPTGMWFWRGATKGSEMREMAEYADRLRAYAARQREDALEEAARICDKQEEYIRKREHTYYDTRIAQGAFECAAAIRAAAKRGKR